MHKGSCLCGSIAFTIKGELPAPNACHCSQCRKQSGHYWASTDVARDAVEFQSDEALKWFTSSENIRRGFCGTCGSFLFWDAEKNDEIAVSMGALEAPTNTKLSMHIFVADKGDYYDISDGLPQNQQ